MRPTYHMNGSCEQTLSCSFINFIKKIKMKILIYDDMKGVALLISASKQRLTRYFLALLFWETDNCKSKYFILNYSQPAMMARLENNTAGFEQWKLHHAMK